MPALMLVRSVLEAQSIALVARDWQAYRATFDFPLAMIGRNATQVAATPDALHRNFAVFSDSVQSPQGTRIENIVESAAFLGDMLCSGMFLTHVLADAVPLVPSFRSTMTLRHTGAGWRCVAVSFPLDLPLGLVGEASMPRAPLFSPERPSE